MDEIAPRPGSRRGAAISTPLQIGPVICAANVSVPIGPALGEVVGRLADELLNQKFEMLGQLERNVPI